MLFSFKHMSDPPSASELCVVLSTGQEPRVWLSGRVSAGMLYFPLRATLT